MNVTGKRISFGTSDSTGAAPAMIALRWLCLAMLQSGLAPFLSAQSIVSTGHPIPVIEGTTRYIVFGPDGAIWFADSASSRIGRITTAGAVTEYATPTPNSNPQGIASGPDGAIWFTEFGANRIGRITVAGAIAEYAIPTPLSGPLEITAGPDGALWFTENKGGVGGKIGRITTAGAIKEYATPTSNSGPYGIASGPDGAIWFVESGAEKIGRITVEGAINEFALPSVLYNSTQITVGPDGALWFTQSGPSLGRITTGGAITSYNLHLPSFASACGITAGPDGALWFTVCGDSKAQIGRITIAGVVGLHSLPTAVPPDGGIILGPDGALWFADGNLIERAVLVFPTPVVVDVRNGANEYLQTIQSNSWVTIYGSNLAPDGSGRVWGARDIVNGRLPSGLDGVSVTINGKPAYVEYISPTQVNVLAPDDVATGPANVIVANGGSFSTAFSAQVQIYSPAFFTFSPPNQRYIAAIIQGALGSAPSSYLAPDGALGASASSRPAKGGDIVELYGTGFGPVNPTPPDGQVFFGAYGTATRVTVTIGGLNAAVLWAGLVSPGLVLLNAIVPIGLPTGDAPIVATVGGVQSQSKLFIPVQQ